MKNIHFRANLFLFFIFKNSVFNTNSVFEVFKTFLYNITKD